MAARIYTAKEYAALMRASVQAVTKACRAGTIRAYRVGAAWRIPFDADDIERVAKENKRAAT